MSIQIIVSGALGRMGREISSKILALPDKFKLNQCLERPGHPDLGSDLGSHLGLDPINVVLKSELAKTENGVLIDFTSAKATLNYAEKCADLGLALVTGSTGFSLEELAHLEKLAKKTPILWAPNMSLGINVMYKIVAQMASALEGYDLEVVEIHHRLKKDAPSGTALKLYEHLAQARDLNLKKAAVFGRDGLIGERSAAEIGVFALRGGEVVGDHTVYFCGPGERLELTHRAQTRDTFVQGALRAALWIVDKKPGLYDLSHVLGL